MAEFQSHAVHSAPEAPPGSRKAHAFSTARHPPIRPDYPAVSPELAALTRRIGRGRNFPLPGLGPDAAFCLKLPAGDTTSWNDVVGVAGSFGAVNIARGRRLLRTLTGIDIDSASGSDLQRWNWIESAVIGQLECTPFASACSLSVAPAPITDDAVPLQILVRTRAHLVTTVACASVSTWNKLLDCSVSSAALLPGEPYLNTPLVFPVRIACHSLPGHVLKGIRPGDVFLPAERMFHCDGTGRLHLGLQSLRVRFASPDILEVTIVEKTVNNENELEFLDNDADRDEYQPGNEDQGAGAGAYAGTSSGETTSAGTAGFPDADGEANYDTAMDNVPVKLDFDLGRLHMRLGEVRAVGCGTVLTIDGGSTDAVTIRIAGKAIGLGEIVDVGGQLGIRVIAWGKPC